MAVKVKKIDNPYTQEQAEKHRMKIKSNQIVKKRLTVFGGLLLLTVLIIGLMVLFQLNANHQLKEEHAQKEAQLEKLRDREIALKERLKQLNSKEYITKIARSEYFLSNDGEMIFKIPDEKEKKQNK